MEDPPELAEVLNALRDVTDELEKLQDEAMDSYPHPSHKRTVAAVAEARRILRWPNASECS